MKTNKARDDILLAAFTFKGWPFLEQPTCSLEHHQCGRGAVVAVVAHVESLGKVPDDLGVRWQRRYNGAGQRREGVCLHVSGGERSMRPTEDGFTLCDSQFVKPGL